MAQSLINDPNLSIQEICETLQVSKATLYRYLGKKKPSK
ncbi:helix-turn-helix domain-containing protein [Polycladomyces zharkentensis]|nr:helix-turn-helix domain-containing protein [Polycladomyces sp. WAk]